MTACNLSCTSTGCELTEIAQNQPLIFSFSKDIDLNSVSTASISLRTQAGEEPVGRYLVNGNIVTFLPDVRPVGGTTFFGFDPGAVYDLRIEAGANNTNALMSTAGDRLTEPFTCRLRVTLGVLDVDGLAPRANLLEPRILTDVDRDVLVKLQFSEIIDIGAFFGTNAGTGPIRFLMRNQQINAVSGLAECDPNSTPIALAGAPRVVLDSVRGVTEVTYRSPQRLPPGRCFEVVITDRVKDLAGTPATLQTFHLFTEATSVIKTETVEMFADETMMDRDLSSGTWDGKGRFGAIGGDGRHGEFRLTLLRQLSPEIIEDQEYAVYEMDLDRTPIPPANTIEGRGILVTDGDFHFSKFVLPELTKLVFRGSHPVRLNVRGLLQIDGLVELRGGDVIGYFDPSPDPMIEVISQLDNGQQGGAGAAGAGSGGAGADKPDGVVFDPRYNGQAGESGSVLAGHAYATAAQNTGGRGSPAYPADALNTSTTLTLPVGFPLPFQVGMVANGGGGGGHTTPGDSGELFTHESPNPGDRGPAGAGGGGFPQLVPLPPNTLSHEHFLITGSGGGGGGGHSMLSFQTIRKWSSGAGGAGGAGAILLRAGHRLATGANSQILASGGSVGDYDLGLLPGFAPPAPGGGGSGGSVVMQGGDPDETEILGLIDVRGGTGSRIAHPSVTMKGGDGADGLVRLETPLPLPAMGTIQPPVGPYRTGELTEIDDTVAFQSDWYSTGEFFPPSFTDYTLEVEINGQPMTFSDDPAAGRLAGPGEPVELRIQGALLDPLTGEPDPLNIRPWRFYVGPQGSGSGQPGLVDDSATGFRFLITLNRSVLGLATEIVITKLTIRYEI